MGFKLKLSQSEKQKPEAAAKDFCSETRKRYFWLKCQTSKPETLQKVRKKMLLFRDEYNRNRGSGYRSQLVQIADRVSFKVLEIVSLNPEDWNDRRRGQQFRRLDELLADFEVEWFRSRRTPEAPDNVVPFRTL